MDETLLTALREAAGKNRSLRFDEFQRIALYHPVYGFFSRSAERAGRDGDFLTSPEVAPLFAEVLAGVLAKDASALDAKEFHVLEIGAGRGTLARDLFHALRFTPLAKRIHFHLVEISAAARAAQADVLAGIPSGQWSSYPDEESLPREPWPCGALLANELFDNLPVRRVMQTTKLEEVHVKVGARGLREQLLRAPPELSAYLEGQGIRLSVGQAAEVSLEAPALLARLVSHFRAGSVLLIDYGDEAKRLYDPERFPNGSLAAHRAHTTHTDYYGRPGEDDLTAHVNFTPLLETLDAAGYERRFFGTQMRFLLENGLAEILERRRNATQDEFEKLVLTQHAKQLYHPEAMGEAFRVLHARKLA